MIEQFAATASQRSANPFCHGLRQEVRNDSIPMSRTVAGTYSGLALGRLVRQLANDEQPRD